jgi:Tfp pilus assembly protein PilF
VRLPVVFFLVTLTGAPAVHGQAVGQVDTLAVAAQLSAAGDFPGATALLQPFVTNHPEIAEAWLLLALNQYWAGRGEAARSTFAEGTRRHPSDRPLIASYARFLMDKGNFREARTLLARHPDPDAELLTLKGTLAYWRGDLTTARRAFRRALVRDGSHGAAAQQLAEIHSLGRPWIRTDARIGFDNQPVEHRRVVLTGGFFLTPLQVAEVEITRGDQTGGGEQFVMNAFQATHRKTWSALPARSTVSVGGVDRLDNFEVTYAGRLGLRVVDGLEIEAAVQKRPYLYTVGSLSESVFPVSSTIGLSLDRRGWLGQVVVGQDRFADENSSLMAYAWILAPVVRSPAITAGVGYVFNYQHAAENRFAPVMTSPPAPGRPASWEGRYRPYYTPRDWQTHGLTGNVSVRPIRRVTLSLNGSYAVAGTESAPYIYQAGGGRPPLIGFYEHRIHPWNVRGELNVEVLRGTNLRMEAEHMKTTWYETTAATMSVVTSL